MVLSDRFAGKTPPTLLKRTLLYVLAFGLGSLLIVTILGFTMVSIAEGVLPAPKEAAPRKPGAPGEPKEAAAGPGAPKMPASKLRPGVAPDGEETADGAEEESDQQL